jgi:hypothetical protein
LLTGEAYFSREKGESGLFPDDLIWSGQNQLVISSQTCRNILTFNHLIFLKDFNQMEAKSPFRSVVETAHF